MPGARAQGVRFCVAHARRAPVLTTDRIQKWQHSQKAAITTHGLPGTNILLVWPCLRLPRVLYGSMCAPHRRCSKVGCRHSHVLTTNAVPWRCHRCSTVVYETLGRCWSFEPSARPAFDALVEFFKGAANTAADNNLRDMRDTEGVLLVPSRSRQNDYVDILGPNEDSPNANEGPGNGSGPSAPYGVVQPRHAPAEPQRHDTPCGAPNPAAEGGQVDVPYGTPLAAARLGDGVESHAPYGASRPAGPRSDEGTLVGPPHGAPLPAGLRPGGGTLHCPMRPHLVGQQVHNDARVDAPFLPAEQHAAASTPSDAARASHHDNPYVDLQLRETTFGWVDPMVRGPFCLRVGAAWFVLPCCTMTWVQWAW